MRALVWVLLAATALTCEAALPMSFVEVDYDDVYGQRRSLPDLEENWINPSGRLRIKVAGEVGAVMQAILETEGGGPTEYAQSAPLDAKDWIALGEKDTIGAYLTVPIPGQDGRYRLTVHWVDASGQEKIIAVRSLVIDRTPPEMTGSWRYRGGLMFDGETVANAEHWIDLGQGAVINAASANEVSASGIADRLAGVESIDFFQEESMGESARGGVVWSARYDPRSQTARMWKPAQIIADAREGNVQRIGFVVQDRAGNRAVFARTLTLSGPCLQGDAVLEEIRVDDGTWAPVAAGANAQKATTGVRFRIPAARSAQSDPGTGIAAVDPSAPDDGAWPPKPISSDGLFTRYEVTTTQPIENPYATLRSATHTLCAPRESARATASKPPESAQESAVAAILVKTASGQERGWTRADPGGSEDNQGANRNASRPALIRLDAQEEPNGVRVEVVPQAFNLTVQIGSEECEIAAGDIGCDMEGLGMKPSGNQELAVVTERLVVKRSKTGQPIDNREIALYRDRLLPEILGHRFEPDHMTLELSIAEEAPEALWIDSGIAEVWVEAETQGGKSVRLDGTVDVEQAGTFNARVSLAQLTEGSYRLRAYASDLNGNASFPLLIPRFVRASAAGELRLRINADDGPADADVESLERITVADDSGSIPQDWEVWFAISGGDESRVTQVRGVRTKMGARPGFIPLEPSLGDNAYTLTVTATDGNGNVREGSGRFRYRPRPARLEGGTDLAIPAVTRATRRADGSWPLTTTPVTRTWSGGGPVRGRHHLRIALSPDAAASLRIAAQELRPGEALIVPDYDFDTNQQKIVLPVRLGDGASHAHGYIGALSIAVALPDVPALALAVRTYTASDLIAAHWSKPAYRPNEGDARVLVHTLNEHLCKGGLLLFRDGLALNETGSDESAGTTLCAINWKGVPDGLDVDVQTGGLAGTVPAGGEEMAARFQAGFAVRDESGGVTFLPSGEEVEAIAAVVAEEQPIGTLLPGEMTPSQGGWLAASGWPWDSWWEGEVWSQWLSGTKEDSPAILAEGDTQHDSERGRVRVAMAADATTRCFVGAGDGARLCLEDRDVMHVLAIGGEAVHHSEEVVVMSGRVGVASRDAPGLAPTESGSWHLRVHAEQGTEVGAASLRGEEGWEGQTDGNGEWSLALGRLSPGRYRMRVVAERVVEDHEQGCSERIEALTVLVVRDGSPIAATLLESNGNGDPDGGKLVRIALSIPERAADVQAVHWEERDRDTREWRRVTRADDHWQLNATLMGRVDLRATLVNAYSGIESTAVLENTERQAAKPLSIDTVPLRVRDGPAMLSVRNGQGDPAIAAWGGWNTDSGRLVELGGGTATLEVIPDEPGDWILLAVHQDSAGRRERALSALRAGGDELPRLRIEGPERAEIGNTLRYSVGGIPRQQQQQWTLRWKLPDGTVPDGSSVDYTPKAGDGPLWITANRGSGDTREEVSATASPTLWTYAWPAFEIKSKGVEDKDGWQGVYVATTRSIMRGGQEGPSYQWELPEGAQASGWGQERRVRFAPNVERRMAVTIADMRGNIVTLHDQQADTLEPLSLELKAQTEDPWARAPTDGKVFFHTVGLARSERIVGTRLWVNGALASDKLADFHVVPMPRAQTLQVDAEVTTSAGRKARGSTSLEAHEGKAPSCRLLMSGDQESGLKAAADCALDRGEMAGYNWVVEYGTGEVRDFGIREGELTLSAAHLKRGVREIRMRAFDDRGVSSAEVTRQILSSP